MIRWLFLLLALSAPLFGEEDAQHYVHEVVFGTVASLGVDGLLRYQEETFTLDEEGRIEELTLHMDVSRVLDHLEARDFLHWIHGSLVRNINVAQEAADYFTNFPLRDEQVGVRLYCASESSTTPPMLGGALHQMMLRAMQAAGHI